MENFEILACSAAGVEAVTKRELFKLGYGDAPASFGRISFNGTLKDVLMCNVNLRTADRILIKIAQFSALTFDDLFEGVKAVCWKDFMSADQRVVVAAKSVNSKLFAVSAIQSLAKKAIAENLQKAFGLNRLSESGSEMKVEVSLKDDVATVCIDTSGAGLHKRGYRDLVGSAPLKETLAAAIIMLSVWNPDRPFVDLFCGSGTLPIEAAMIGLNMAPSLNRDFAVCNWKFFDKNVFDEVREEALSKICDRELSIAGYDIDKSAVSQAMRHMRRCGLEGKIHFQQRDFKDFSSKKKYGVIISNPPYGERLCSQKEVRELYSSLGKKFEELDTWSMGIITSYYDFERALGKKADKNRKLFNSNLECRFFQYLGPKPQQAKIQE